MRLFRSEFLRARSRRLVPMVIVGGLLAVFVGLGIAAINSEPPTSGRRSTRRRRATISSSSGA